MTPDSTVTGPVGCAAAAARAAASLRVALRARLASAGGAALDHDAALAPRGPPPRGGSGDSACWVRLPSAFSVEARELRLRRRRLSRRTRLNARRDRCALEAGRAVRTCRRRVPAGLAPVSVGRRPPQKRTSSDCGALRPQPAHVLPLRRRPQRLAPSSPRRRLSHGSYSSAPAASSSPPVSAAQPSRTRRPSRAALRLHSSSTAPRHRSRGCPRRRPPTASATPVPPLHPASRSLRPSLASAWWAGTPQYFEPGSAAFGQRLPFERTRRTGRRSRRRRPCRRRRRRPPRPGRTPSRTGCRSSSR